MKQSEIDDIVQFYVRQDGEPDKEGTGVEQLEASLLQKYGTNLARDKVVRAAARTGGAVAAACASVPVGVEVDEGSGLAKADAGALARRLSKGKAAAGMSKAAFYGAKRAGKAPEQTAPGTEGGRRRMLVSGMRGGDKDTQLGLGTFDYRATDAARRAVKGDGKGLAEFTAEARAAAAKRRTGGGGDLFAGGGGGGDGPMSELQKLRGGQTGAAGAAAQKGGFYSTDRAKDDAYEENDKDVSGMFVTSILQYEDDRVDPDVVAAPGDELFTEGDKTDRLKARNQSNRLAAAEMALVGQFATEGADDDDFAALEAATADAAPSPKAKKKKKEASEQAAAAEPAAPVAGTGAVGALDDGLFDLLGGDDAAAGGKAPGDDFDFSSYISQEKQDGGGGLFD